MKFTRKLSAIALGLLTALSVSSIANAQCDPLPGTRIGDVNADGAHDVLDVVGVVNVAFRGFAAPRLLGAADLNGDGITSDVLDVVTIVNVAFRGAAANFPYRIYPLTGRTASGPRYTLIADDSIQYRIVGVFSVGSDTNGAVPPVSCDKTDSLFIQAGTELQGDTSLAAPSALIIRRYGYIHSVGTPTEPILMTSMLAPGSRGRSNWGGLVINGCDSCNEASGQFASEGNGGVGGGFESGDNSGCVIYTRQEFSGRLFLANNELNGITLNGVGRGTTIHHVQVNQNADDGIEWFGGTVDVHHVVVSGVDDDGLDTDLGCNFKCQWGIVVQDSTKPSSTNHNGFECDGRPASPYNPLPRSQPRFANITVVGQGFDYAQAATTNDGAHIRRGTWGEWYNILWTRFERGLDLDNRSGSDSTLQSDPPSSGIYGSIFYDVGLFEEDASDADVLGVEYAEGEGAGGLPGVAPWWNHLTENAGPNPLANILTASGYTDAGFPDFRPLAGSLPTTWVGNVALPGYFDAAGSAFVGAVNAGDPSPWYMGWTDFSQD